VQVAGINGDMSNICASVKNRENVMLDNGYKLIISNVARMDDKY